MNNVLKTSLYLSVILDPELLKDGVVKVDVSSIGTKFDNFVQAGCRDSGSHRSTVQSFIT